MVKTSFNTKMKGFGKSISSIDGISRLPDATLIEILSYLSTKDSVRTSVLSKRWNKLWLEVPTLDLEYNQFRDEVVFSEFIDTSLEVRKQLGLNVKTFRLVYDAAYEHYHDDFMWKIKNVIKRKVSNLTIVSHFHEYKVSVPLSLYSCATLVRLDLSYVSLDAPISESRKVFYLPLLKTMHLNAIQFDGREVFETFISSCPILKELTMIADVDDSFLVDISVCSQSLRRFTLEPMDSGYKSSNVEIDAPNLEYMSIRKYRSDEFAIHSIVNLYRLDVSFTKDSWELFPLFIECCPNLHDLILEFDSLPEDVKLSKVPEGFLSSLEYVGLKTPSGFTETSSMMKLAIYFVRNCGALKKLMVSESFKDIITKIRRIPKRSKGCKIVMV